MIGAAAVSRRLLLLLAALAVAAPAAAQQPGDVFVIRHMQRGTGDDPGLTPEGRAAAERLAELLESEQLTALYASTTNRARETALPVAARLGLILRLYDPADPAKLIAEVSREPGPVLIVGHSNTVPDLVRRLGAPAPAAIADDDYGRLFRVSRAAGAVTETQVR